MTTLAPDAASTTATEDSALERLAARAGQLYSLPAVAVKVLELTNNPQVDTRELKRCIENDPALTGKILRVVNSSLFGLSRQVSDLNQALALLGTKPLKLLVLGFSLPPGLYAGLAADVLGRYWRHTLTKAVAGREIAETLCHTPGDDAFIAALLQDLGILLLIQELGAPYLKFLDKVLARSRDLSTLERSAMGFDHAMLSARLLAGWGLPMILVEAVAWHPGEHEVPDSKPHDTALSQVVYLAELIARLLADGQSDVLAEILEFGQRFRGLTKSQLDRLVADLQAKVDQLADVFKLQLPAGLEFQDVLLKAHQQLSAVAAEAAEDLLRSRQDAPKEDPALLADFQVLADAMARLERRTTLSAEEARVAELVVVDHLPAATAPHSVATAESKATFREPTSRELLDRLALAVTACRQSHCALSLLLVELGATGDQSGRGLTKVQRLLASACQEVDHPYKACVRIDGNCFGLVLPDCERRAAIELGNQLIASLRPALQCLAKNSHPRAVLSAGVATVALPPKNFPPQDLLTGASRCLYASHASGGGVVKSIEIY